MTTTIARKIATLIASVVPMLCLLMLSFVGNGPGTAGIIMGIGKYIGVFRSDWNVLIFFDSGITSIGAMYCGFLINHIDIAPNYAGTLMAITNTLATLPGIILPFFIDAMTHGNVGFK